MSSWELRMKLGLHASRWDRSQMFVSSFLGEKKLQKGTKKSKIEGVLDLSGSKRALRSQ